MHWLYANTAVFFKELGEMLQILVGVLQKPRDSYTLLS